MRVWRRPLRELSRAALDCLLGAPCVGCGAAAVAAGDRLCAPCARGLGRRAAGGCRRCGEPVVAGRPCGADHGPLRNLAFLVAPLWFAGTGGALVRRFKLDGDAGAGGFLAREMRRAWRAGPGRGCRRAVAVAVPLHRERRRARGFDQAEWLVERLARPLALTPATGVLRRVRATRAQGDPRTTSRPANVSGAFALRSSAAVAGRRVVLVDDVFTSGATLRECARLLRGAGATEVAGLVACRSRKNPDRP